MFRVRRPGERIRDKSAASKKKGMWMGDQASLAKTSKTRNKTISVCRTLYDLRSQA